MKNFKIILAIGFMLILANKTFARNVIRVACIGNSITYGAGIPNRDKNSYPAQLQAYLGSGYLVQNFGVSGRTLLSKGDYPYIKTSAYKESLSFNPDIVIIKLGTNDSKPQNWKYKEDLKADFMSLVSSYRNLSSHPRIILLTPVKCFLSDGSEISNQLIGGEIRSFIEKMAYENQLEIINLYNLFGDKWEQHLMPDKLHPSSIGAGMIAGKIFEYLILKRENKVNIIKALHIKGKASFNFHGYKGYEFTNEGTTCKVVEPYVEAVRRPWIIRARFWDHEPQTDIALLENGFHLVYCDVADMYGSDKAVQRWNSFYRRMHKAGFNSKVVLEGMSRGGLIVYNWAAQNPEKVACIYADAPVMDIKSWPMGTGKSEGSPDDTRKMLQAYGFGNEQEALNWKRNPVDCVSVIAKYRIPVIHVVGDADKVVPVEENTGIFEERLKQLNCPITVVHKPGVDHHPHSLNNPSTIVRFILKATGRSVNRCIHPVPGNEFRSTAGWTEGADWHTISEDISATLQGKNLKLLLLGNSITQGWGGNRKAVTYKPGKRAMDAAVGENQWESAGIAGDRTQNLLWRIRYGNYNVCHPKYAVIAIGINNLFGEADTPEQVAEGIIAVANEAKIKLPQTQIILLGLLPAGKEVSSDIRIKCNQIHAILAKTPIKDVKYINPTSWFVDANWAIKSGLYGGDYIHLTANGYQVFSEEISKLIK